MNPLFFRRNQILGEEIELSQEEIEHLKSLRKLKEKTFQVEIRNGKGECVTYHFESGKRKGKETQRESIISEEVELSVLMGIPKPGKLEFWLQKGTELGITNFNFTVFRYSDRKELNQERCYRVIQEAAAQTRRTTLPCINFFQNIEEAISKNNTTNYFYMHPYTNSKFDFSQNETHAYTPIIGPEAGFHETEISYFQDKNIKGFTFGKNILRMETAAIAITTIIQYERNK